MNNMLKASFLSNQASFGFHWIYDSEYLSHLAKNESLLFKVPDIKHYQEAKTSYFAYPHAKQGHMTTQGMILKWLVNLYQEKMSVSNKDYEDLIYEHIKPGGTYEGYIETYGKKLIYNRLINELSLDLIPLKMDDLHLVGFMPYLAGKAYDISNEESFELAKIFTDQIDFLSFYRMFDFIIEHIHKLPIKEVLEKAISLAPTSYHEKLYQAISMEDTMLFISKYAGTSCHLPVSIPLIYHLLAISSSFDDMWKLNTMLGGASSERGLLLGAILSFKYELPDIT